MNHNDVVESLMQLHTPRCDDDCPLCVAAQTILSLRKDAARFVWVLDPVNASHPIWGQCLLGEGSDWPLDEIRAAIDEAMNAPSR